MHISHIIPRLWHQTYMYLHKYKKQFKGWSRDGNAKKYTNKIYRDNLSHPLYIPTLAFFDIICILHLLMMSTPALGYLYACGRNPWIVILYWLSDYLLAYFCMCPMAIKKASVGIYSGCDKLSSCLCTFGIAIPTSSFNIILYETITTSLVAPLYAWGHYVRPM